ncbi:unnamed protein product, partial [Phaeothamnion confervicola]
MDSRTVGVLGGGQLGRMMAEAGHRLGITVAVLDPGGAESPAGQVAEIAVEGSFRDPAKIRKRSLGERMPSLSFSRADCVHLTCCCGIPTPDFLDAPTLYAARAAGVAFGYPFMLKAKRLAYDGRGNAVVASEGALPAAWAQLGGDAGSELYVERWCPFVKELAVMVVRSAKGEVACYPVVDTVQKDNICHTTLCPAEV